jgi:hypothetical protein
MAITALTLLGIPGADSSIPAKTPADYPPVGVLVEQFDIWRESYAGALVSVYRAGTTELMPCFSDINLTTPISNPITLLSRTDSLGRSFGKFAQSVYVPYAYELDIDTTEQTGRIIPPLTTLNGEDASYALVTPSNSGTRARQLRDILGERISFLDYGEVTSNPETNTTTLNSAISAAAANGGGAVVLPAGTIVINSISLPEDVHLIGEGIDTTTLQSTASTNVITVTGDNAGMSDMTLDGLQKNGGSVGIYGKDVDDINLTRVRVKRFVKGIQWQGGNNHVYKRLYLDDCTNAIQCHGDQDFTGGDNGDMFKGLDWFQGSVTNTTGSGLELLVRDNYCINNRIRQVDFDSNIGSDGAVLVSGGRFIQFDNCSWSNNNTNIKVEDNSDTTISFRETVGLYFMGGEIAGGTNTFDGLCQDIIFEQMNLDGCTFQANVPDNQILLRNNVESGTLFTGVSTRFSRWHTNRNGVIKGATTTATAAVVFQRTLQPNEVVALTVTATAERQNTDEHAIFMMTHGAKCAPATLNYDDQSANFTAGDEIVGATSGARAIIVSDADSGTTGTLSLAAVSGEFVDNEIIEEVTNNGSARVNGTLIPPASAALSGSATTHHSTGSNTGSAPTGWALAFQINGLDLEVTVKGASGADVAWSIDIKEVSL